jgi:hypothetical protein
MHSRGLVRSALIVLTIGLCLGSLLRTADADTASCTGDQTNADMIGDACSSFAISGMQGPSTASAQASGRYPSEASAAQSGASNNSSATSEAYDTSDAQASASDSSIANASASRDSRALVEDSGGSFSQGTASEGSQATSSAFLGGVSIAEARNGSSALASTGTPNSFVCAYAVNGSFASASDTSAPLCDATARGGIAVVVSPKGNCGPVDQSPCAQAAGTPEIDPSMATGGLTILLIGLVLVMERRRVQKQSLALRS